MGDFNLILQAAGKNNTRVNRCLMGRFRQLVDDLELKEVHLNGRAFTWLNARERPTLERIDKVLVSSEWEILFPASFLRALPSTASDHCPLLLSTAFIFGTHKNFHFESFWPKLEGFQDTVSKAWRGRARLSDPLRNLGEEGRRYQIRFATLTPS